MKYLTFSKLINHYNKSSIGYGKFFRVLLIAQLIINPHSLESFLVLSWVFSALNSFLGLLKVGICVFFFLKFVKKKVSWYPQLLYYWVFHVNVNRSFNYFNCSLLCIHFWKHSFTEILQNSCSYRFCKIHLRTLVPESSFLIKLRALTLGLYLKSDSSTVIFWWILQNF